MRCKEEREAMREVQVWKPVCKGLLLSLHEEVCRHAQGPMLLPDR